MAITFEGIIGTGGMSALTTVDIPEPSGGVGHMLVILSVVKSINNFEGGPEVTFWTPNVIYPSVEYACYGAVGPFLQPVFASNSLDWLYVGSGANSTHISPMMVPVPIYAPIPAGTLIYATSGVAGFIEGQMALALFSGVDIGNQFGGRGIVDVDALATATIAYQNYLDLIWISQLPPDPPDFLVDYRSWESAATVTQPLGPADVYIGALPMLGAADPDVDSPFNGGPVAGWYNSGHAVDVPSPSWNLSTIHEFTGTLLAGRTGAPGVPDSNFVAPWRVSFGWGATSDLSFSTWPVGSLGFDEDGPEFFATVYTWKMITSRNFQFPRGFGLKAGTVDKCPIAPPNIQRRHRAAQ